MRSSFRRRLAYVKLNSVMNSSLTRLRDVYATRLYHWLRNFAERARFIAACSYSIKGWVERQCDVLCIVMYVRSGTIFSDVDRYKTNVSSAPLRKGKLRLVLSAWLIVESSSFSRMSVSMACFRPNSRRAPYSHHNHRLLGQQGSNTIQSNTTKSKDTKITDI